MVFGIVQQICKVVPRHDVPLFNAVPQCIQHCATIDAFVLDCLVSKVSLKAFGCG
jgi:hypothetical protein